MEMAQLALQAGFPAEAQAGRRQGFAGGALGTGPEAERHKRLRDLVARKLDEHVKARDESLALAERGKDGTSLVNMRA